MTHQEKLTKVTEAIHKAHHSLKEMVGKKYGKLTAIRITDKRSPQGELYWIFKCECGNEAELNGTTVRRGNARSCGCLRKVPKSHGETGSLTYKTWTSMKHRCLNPANPHYKLYGGRGITVCKRWLKFEEFLKDMGEKPRGMSLDCIDTNGNYSPENCRWASMATQQNNRRNNKHLTYQGITKTMSEWAKDLGMNYKTLKAQIRNGWSLERAFKLPLKSNRKSNQP